MATFEIWMRWEPLLVSMRLLVMKISFVDDKKTPASWAKGYVAFSRHRLIVGFWPVIFTKSGWSCWKVIAFFNRSRKVDMVSWCKQWEFQLPAGVCKIIFAWINHSEHCIEGEVNPVIAPGKVHSMLSRLLQGFADSPFLGYYSLLCSDSGRLMVNCVVWNRVKRTKSKGGIFFRSSSGLFNNPSKPTSCLTT